MNSETTKLWNFVISSLRRDQVLCLVRMGLEADNDGDVAADLESVERSGGGTRTPDHLQSSDPMRRFGAPCGIMNFRTFPTSSRIWRRNT